MITVKEVTNKKQKKQFIDFPYALYRNDPAFVPPLKKERADLLNPKANPYFEKAKVKLFLAYDDHGKVVGRLSAQVNDSHNERYNEKTGHFGFFDSVDDRSVVKALFSEGEKWLRHQGMNQVVGPFNLSINEESGLLVKGHEHPAYPYMPHNFPYYENLLTDLGFHKEKDLIAWRYDSSRPVPEGAQQISDFVASQPGLTIREVDKKNLDRDVRIIADIFNSAWSRNWGFIPWSESELKKMVKDFQLVLEPKLALIAEVNGEPAGISLALPNYNEAIKDLNGRLFPFGVFKFLYRLKTNKIKTARLALLGIKKEFRHENFAGLSVYLYTEMHRRSQALGQTGGELSWTLDDNEKINHGIALMGGDPYKVYRLYKKALI